MSFINIFREGLWPGGKLKPPGTPRTAEEKLRTRDEANRKLSSLVPGKSNLSSKPLKDSNLLCRLGCEYDWAIKCSPWCP